MEYYIDQIVAEIRGYANYSVPTNRKSAMLALAIVYYVKVMFLHRSGGGGIFKPLDTPSAHRAYIMRPRHANYSAYSIVHLTYPGYTCLR